MSQVVHESADLTAKPCVPRDKRQILEENFRKMSGKMEASEHRIHQLEWKTKRIKQCH